MPAGVAVCAYAGTIVQSLDCKDEAVRSDQSIPETRRKIKRGKKGKQKQKQKKVTFLAILKNISYFCTQGSLIY